MEPRSNAPKAQAIPAGARGSGDSPGAVIPAAATPAALTEQNAALRARIAELEHKLEVTRQLQKAEEGDPVPAPPNLDERFSQDALRANFEAALKEAGFTDAQVTSADCTEFPCILYGEGMGSREDFDRLRGTQGAEPYRDDNRSAFGFTSQGKDGEPAKQHFGVALYPDDLPKETREALSKRLDYRVRQMKATFAQ